MRFLCWLRHLTGCLLLPPAPPIPPEQTRSVPANATVFHIPASHVKRALLRTAFSYLPFTQCNGYAGPEERAAVRGSLKRRGFLTYFLAKADAVYRAVSKS